MKSARFSQDLKAGSFGVLGDDQLSWLKKDLDGLSSSTPVVVYAHVPSWAVYPTKIFRATPGAPVIVDAQIT